MHHYKGRLPYVIFHVTARYINLPYYDLDYFHVIS